MQVFHAPHVLLYAVSIAGVTAIAAAQESPIDIESPPETTTTTIPGTGTPGVDWEEIPECGGDGPCPLVLGSSAQDVRSPIRVTTTRWIDKVAHRQQIRNCSRYDNIGPFEYDMRYETKHAWRVGAGVTVGAEGQIESGLLSKAIVNGRVSLSATGRVEGELSRSKTIEHGLKICVDRTPSCFSIKILSIFDDYESTVEQDLGELHTCIVEGDDGAIEEIGQCVATYQTLSATGDGDAGHTLEFQDGEPCGGHCGDDIVADQQEAVIYDEAEIQSLVKDSLTCADLSEFPDRINLPLSSD